MRPRICWADNLNVLDRSDWKLCEAIPAGPGVAPQNLFRKLESLGDFRCGTISVNYRKCGKSKCGCARKDHPGRGPQYLWNVSIGGKTQARNLPVGPEPEKTEREVERYRTFIRLSQETGRGQRPDLSVAPGPHRLQSFCTLGVFQPALHLKQAESSEARMMMWSPLVVALTARIRALHPRTVHLEVFRKTLCGSQRRIHLDIVGESCQAVVRFSMSERRSRDADTCCCQNRLFNASTRPGRSILCLCENSFSPRRWYESRFSR